MDINKLILIAIIAYLLLKRKNKPEKEDVLPPAPPVKDTKQLNVCSNFVDQYGTGKCTSIGKFPLVV